MNFIRQVVGALAVVSLACSLQVRAAIDIFEFESANDENRYYQLIDELRCPKCQNQNLSGSDSAIAQDLRKELYRMIDEGQSDAEIKDFMVARYGDYVLYKPRLSSLTMILWFGPVVLLGAGALIVYWVVLKRNNDDQQDQAAPLSDQEQAHLQQLLAKRSAKNNGAES